MTGRKKMIIGWTVFLVGSLVIWVAIFAAMEGYALTHEDSITLSRYVWELSQAWPPVVFLLGLFIGLTMGMLISHFWWRWNPEDPNDRGG